MPFVIDHDPIVGRPQIIGPFETKDEADEWGRKNIQVGVWHSMPLHTAASAVTASSESWSDRPAIHA